MAGLRVSSPPGQNSRRSSRYRETSTPQRPQPNGSNDASPNASSDKENQHGQIRAKSRSMPQPNDASGAPAAKRRRVENSTTTVVPLNDHDRTSTRSSTTLNNSFATSNTQNDDEDDSDDDDEDQQDDSSSDASSPDSSPPETQLDNLNFDPNQSTEERREIRQNYRVLHSEVQDHRQEWMAADSHGLEQAIRRSNNFYENVKQTADATADSGFLVTAGDMTYKRSRQINVGENAQGVDVDEFVGKCIGFMRAAAEQPSAGERTGTQRRRQRQAAQESSDDEEEEDEDMQGDALDWCELGTHAALPHNLRPPVLGFLLGPLSVQKRQRKQPVERKARNRAANPQAQPEVTAAEMKADDMQRGESSDAAQMGPRIHEMLLTATETSRELLLSEWEDEQMTNDEKERELHDKHNLCTDGGLSMFRFAFNPRSFGQTVENLFYVSFLIRDRLAEIKLDDYGSPSLHWHPKDKKRQEGDASAGSRGGGGGGERGRGRNQAVFTLDYERWEELVQLYDIRESVIPHREQDESNYQVDAGGWY